MSFFATKVTLLNTRVLLILSLLGFVAQPTYAFQEGQSLRKTKYEFTDTRISEADTLLKKRQYQQALEAYQKAYDLYESEEFYEGMVYAKERMGYSLRRLGMDSVSVVTSNDAIKTSEQRTSEAFQFLASRAYLSNGMIEHFRDEPLLASKFLDSAMWAYESSSYEDSTLLKGIIDFKFYTYYYSNLSRDTLIKYLNERGRYYEKKVPPKNDAVYLLGDYSRAFYRLGDFQKSVAYALEATRVCEEYNEEVSTFYYTDALFNLGRALLEQRDYSRALDVADRLIDFTLEENPENRDLRGYYNLKAVILNGLGRYAEAAKVFTKVIGLLESRGDSGEFYRSTIMNLGVCRSFMGQFDLAEKHLFDALRKEKLAENSLNIKLSDRYKYLGQHFSQKQDFLMSLTYYDSAIRANIPSYEKSILDFPEIQSKNLTFEILSLFKKKLLAMNDLFRHASSDSLGLLKSSLTYAERTHDLLMFNRQELVESEGKLFLSENFKEMYEAALESSFILYNEENGGEEIYLRKAFKFMGLSKSILFLEQSGELGLVQAILDEPIRERYFQIQSRIELLEQQFYANFDQISTNDSIRIINAELLRLNQSLKDLRSEIEQTTDSKIVQPELDAGAYDKIIRMNAEEPGQALLEFFYGQNDIYVLGLSDRRNMLHRVPIDSTFKDSFDEIVSQTTKKPIISELSDQLVSYKTASYQIYKSLLSGTLGNLDQGVNKLILIPDEELSKLSFEALTLDLRSEDRSFSQLPYLISQYDVRYALSSLRLTAKASPRTAKKTLFGVGYSGTEPSDTRSRFGALPGTEDEVRFLESQFNGDFFFGDSGNKELFLSTARDYDVLHLAVHGEADSSNRYQSTLIFNGTDRVLKTSDLYKAGLEARLAILSACESGIGQINRGEGTFSIARGFALVGVPSIIMSLWKVNDRVSADLMVDFHMNLSQGFDTGKSLSTTKRNYISKSDKYNSHPYYWSAFVALGEAVTLESKSYEHIYALILLSVFTLFFAYKYGLRKRKGIKRSLL